MKLRKINLLCCSAVFASVAALSTCVACSCHNASDEASVGQLDYTKNKQGGITITGLKNASADIKTIVVPNEIDGGEVTTIAEGAFKNCPNLESITLPFVGLNKNPTNAETKYGMLGSVFGDVLYEGLQAFVWQYCDHDGEITEKNWAIPSTLVNVEITNASVITPGAFSQCSNLESIKLNNGVNTINEYAFFNCKSIEQFVFPEELKIINSFAFTNCTSIESINFPEGLNEINAYAFYNCKKAKSGYIHSNVKKVAAKAFSGWQGIILIEGNPIQSGYEWDIEWTDTSVPVVYNYSHESSFHTIGDVQVVICESTDTNVSKYAYLVQWVGQWNIKTVNIPQSITIDGTTYPVRIIGTRIFEDNAYIETVKIPEGIEYIYPNSFIGCTNLQYVNFPKSLLRIGEDAFNGCVKLHGRYEDRTIQEGLSFALDNPGESFVIADRAFYGCKKIVNITFDKNKPLEIGDYAFAYCESLGAGYDNVTGQPLTITLPGFLKTLGKGAFTESFRLAPTTYSGVWTPKVVIEYNNSSNDDLEISESCFEACSNYYVTPEHPHQVMINFDLQNNSNITSIGNNAFCDTWINKLSNINLKSLKTIGDYAFYNSQPTLDNDQAWPLPNSLTSIGDYAFGYAWSVTNWQFGTDDAMNLQHLGEGAFIWCSNSHFNTLDLSHCKKLEINSDNDAPYCFEYCQHLNNVIFPENAEKFERISPYMFDTCLNIKTKIVVPKSVHEVCDHAFSMCSQLPEIEFQGSIDKYEDRIFENCSELTNVSANFSDNIINENIGTGIYYNCMRLTNAPFPVASAGACIKEYAYYANSSLKSYVINPNIVNIKDFAFSGCSGLTSVTIGGESKLNEIGMRAFSGCSSLTALDLRNVKSETFRIGANAFVNCKNLKELWLPTISTELVLENLPFEYIPEPLVIYIPEADLVKDPSKDEYAIKGSPSWLLYNATSCYMCDMAPNVRFTITE